MRDLISSVHRSIGATRRKSNRCEFTPSLLLLFLERDLSERETRSEERECECGEVRIGWGKVGGFLVAGKASGAESSRVLSTHGDTAGELTTVSEYARLLVRRSRGGCWRFV